MFDRSSNKRMPEGLLNVLQDPTASRPTLRLHVLHRSPHVLHENDHVHIATM